MKSPSVFASGQNGPEDASSFRLGGTVNDLISQTMNYTGSITPFNSLCTFGWTIRGVVSAEFN